MAAELVARGYPLFGEDVLALSRRPTWDWTPGPASRTSPTTGPLRPKRSATCSPRSPVRRGWRCRVTREFKTLAAICLLERREGLPTAMLPVSGSAVACCPTRLALAATAPPPASLLRALATNVPISGLQATRPRAPRLPEGSSARSRRHPRWSAGWADRRPTGRLAARRSPRRVRPSPGPQAGRPFAQATLGARTARVTPARCSPSSGAWIGASGAYLVVIAAALAPSEQVASSTNSLTILRQVELRDVADLCDEPRGQARLQRETATPAWILERSSSVNRSRDQRLVRINENHPGSSRR